MQTVEVATWDAFEEALRRIPDAHKSNQTITNDRPALLFRGQPDHNLKLTTTLVRRGKENMSLLDYFRVISRINPQVETFTGIQWKLGYEPDFVKWLQDNSTLLPLWAIKFPGYEFMVYLRHHGFPSPLLDWTSSRYIAAYFAFSRPLSATQKVSMYVYWERPKGSKVGSSDRPHIYRFGRYVNTHRRHFLQQSEYTTCFEREEDIWRYGPHEAAFALDDPDQDLLWKFNIPATERLKVLISLEDYNLNAFSLFGSEESLMETMAVREIDVSTKHH